MIKLVFRKDHSSYDVEKKLGVGGGQRELVGIVRRREIMVVCSRVVLAEMGGKMGQMRGIYRRQSNKDLVIDRT